MRSTFLRAALFAGLAALLPAALTGCGKSSSPESVFAEFKDANEKKDRKRMMGCLTEEAQNRLAAQLIIPGVQMKNLSEMPGKLPAEIQESLTKVSAVLTKHGITDELIKKNPIDPPDPIAIGDFKAPDAYLSVIKDKPQFIADVAEALPKDDTKWPFLEIKSMKDLKIEGTSATAKVLLITNGKEVEEPIQFESKNGVWKVKPFGRSVKGGGSTKG